MSLPCHGCEFLIAATEDGLLDLRDAYYLVKGSEDPQAPTWEGDMPTTRQRYRMTEWASTKSDDSLKRKKGEKKVLGIASPGARRGRVLCCDSVPAAIPPLPCCRSKSGS